MTNMKQQAIRAIKIREKQLCLLSDDIWDHPETAFQEYYAAKAYRQTLEKEGFSVEANLAGIPTAFSGTFGSGGPVIGLLGEYDALAEMSQVSEITEKKALVPGAAGHACGHNLLGVGSLAAAIAVKEYLVQTRCPGTVKFYGCPAEEGGAGKGFMARDGVFDELDLAFSWHPNDFNTVQNNSTLANYQICYRFFGEAAHAAISPELGRSALDAVELMNIGVQFLREHVEPNVRIHYAITDAGGKAPAIVQPYAEVLYLMRAPQIYQVKSLYERVNDIANGAAMMTGTRVEIDFIKACSNILCNETLARLLQKNMEEAEHAHYSEEDIAFAASMQGSMTQKDQYFRQVIEKIDDLDLQAKLMRCADEPIHEVLLPYNSKADISYASSDVGDVSWVCPVAQIGTTTMPAGTAMHSWQEVAVGKSALAKKGMLYAARSLAGAAIDILNDPELVQKAKSEKELRTNGHRFEPPIPPSVKPSIPEKN